MVYHQRTGNLFVDGVQIARGYSGRGAGLNNPAMQDVRGIGPIPQGVYRIGPRIPHHPHVGANAYALIPVSGHVLATHRSGFFAHGDNRKGDESASHGCIVVAPGPRAEAFGPGGLCEVQ